MPVPQRRQSRTRRDKRRTHDKLPIPGLSTCTNCGAMNRPHRVCPECGFFKGVQVMEV